MNILLIFFAIPLAVIIFSIALQKIFKCPFIVAGIIFAIFLIVTFIVNSLIFLVATIIYTIIALITAFIVKIICRILEERNECRRCCDCDRRRCDCDRRRYYCDRSRSDNDSNFCRCNSDNDCDCNRCHSRNCSNCDRCRSNNRTDFITTNLPYVLISGNNLENGLSLSNNLRTLGNGTCGNSGNVYTYNANISNTTDSNSSNAANTENSDNECCENSCEIGRNGTSCTCSQVDNNTISVTGNIAPNSNNGNSGRFWGSYRR